MTFLLYIQPVSMWCKNMNSVNKSNLNGTLLVCDNCLNNWRYFGKNPYYATCSFCKSSVNIRKNKVDMDNMIEVNQEPEREKVDYTIHSNNSANRVTNTKERNIQKPTFDFPIPPFLKNIGVESIRLQNRVLLVDYNGHNLEIRIDQGNSHKGIKYLNFEFKGLPITDKTIDCIESFISDNWNLILSIIDSKKVINLLEGGITDFFGTKKMVKEYES